MKRFLLFALLAIALPASASYNVFYANTNFDTQFGPQYGQKILVTPVFYSNSLAPLQPHMYSCGLATDPYPAGFWISNMLSGRYLFTVQSTPQPTPRIFVIPDGTGNYTLSTADVVATSAGTGFPSYADITNYVNTHAGSTVSIQNNAGLGTNTTFFSVTATNSASTNRFYGFGSSDPTANGTYALTAVLGADGQAIYTNMNGSGRAMVVDCCASDFNATYSIVENTNGNIITWTLVMEHNSFQPGGAWIVGAGTVAIPFSDSGWGTWNPPLRVVGQMQADALSLTNLNGANLRAGTVGQAALASGLTVPVSQTVSNPFVHIRSGAIGAGLTVNNTNWIYQGNVSGSRVTITNADFYAYSTNGAFANVRYLDQILFSDANIQCLVHQKISANKIQCWQLNVGIETTASGGVTNSSNWYLIPYLFKVTDFTIGGENYPTVFDSNGSLHLTSIDNEGAVAFHLANGTAMQFAASTSQLAGLQMGLNGMYLSISSVGSNFVNARQFVLPAETLSESQVFLTNGMVDFQFGFTNRAALPLKFASPILPLAGIYGGVVTNNATGLNIAGQFTANTINNNAGGGISGTFTGDGSQVTNLAPENVQATGKLLPSGTVATNLLAIPGPFITTNAGGRTHSYNAGGLTNLNASQLATGTIPTARLDTLANQYGGALTNNDTRSLTLVGPVNSTNSFKSGTNNVVMTVAVVDVTNAASGSIGTTTIFTAPSSGMFDADIQLSTTVAGSAGTVTETLSWTDDIGATSATSSTCALSSQARVNPNVVGRFITSGSSITYATTVSGASGSPTYAVHIRIIWKP